MQVAFNSTKYKLNVRKFCTGVGDWKRAESENARKPVKIEKKFFLILFHAWSTCKNYTQSISYTKTWPFFVSKYIQEMYRNTASAFVYSSRVVSHENFTLLT